jgi:hydroxylamine dehydrogenase
MRKLLVLILTLLPALAMATAPSRSDSPPPLPADAASVAGRCMTCHKDKSPGLYRQWYKSEHAKHNVTCIDCHRADKADPDAYEHEGGTISTLVTPLDCGRCHKAEYEQVDASYHATAGLILESKDAYLAHAAGGHPAAVAGCESCHGTKVKIDPSSPNKLDILSWPNSGIGRLNPDGSKGSCNACHTRHSFDIAQARKPEACSKCHLGPDHPQKEIYEESKHGNAYYTHLGEMNMKSKRWVVGTDYFEAPTCATCHMSAGPKQKVTHDVGQRISWTLRPPVSKMKEDWRKKRGNMQDICSACHGKRFTDGHYAQLDGLVRLYNEKFAKPAGAIMAMIKKKGLMKNKAAFSNKIEWIYWEIWHHEGRRARHGAAMMGPDYTWWHGIYDVAQHFYFKLIPEARKYGDAEVNAALDKMISEDPLHNWLTRPGDEIKKDIRTGKVHEIYKDYFKPLD